MIEKYYSLIHPEREYIVEEKNKYLPSHCIRFYAVTALNEYGIDRNRIQHTAGHCCPSTTEHYIRVARSNDLTKQEANTVYGYESA